MTNRSKNAEVATTTKAAASWSAAPWVSPMLSGEHGMDAAEPGADAATQ